MLNDLKNKNLKRRNRLVQGGEERPTVSHSRVSLAFRTRSARTIVGTLEGFRGSANLATNDDVQAAIHGVKGLLKKADANSDFMGETLGGHIASELLRDWATLQVRYRFSAWLWRRCHDGGGGGWCTVVAPSGYFGAWCRRAVATCLRRRERESHGKRAALAPGESVELARFSHTPSGLAPEAVEVLDVPGVESLRIRLHCAVRDDRIIGRAARHTSRGPFFQHLAVCLPHPGQ